MGTKNPKISAYVPQEVFDRFQHFQEERGLSASKAATAIFCDYFGIEQTASSLPSGITLTRIETLEKRLAELEDKFESQPIYQNAALVPAESQAISATSEAPQLSAKVEKTESYDENPPLPLSYPKSEPNQTTSEPSAKKTAEGKSTLFVTAEDLASRLSCHPQSIKNFKNKNSTERFIQWTTEKDPDGIPWNYQMEVFGRAMGFYPYCDLSNEQQQSLAQWFDEVVHQ